MLRGQNVTAEQAYDALVASMNAVYEDVVHGTGEIDEEAHPTEHALFDNPFKVIDGPW